MTPNEELENQTGGLRLRRSGGAVLPCQQRLIRTSGTNILDGGAGSRVKPRTSGVHLPLQVQGSRQESKMIQSEVSAHVPKLKQTSY